MNGKLLFLMGGLAVAQAGAQQSAALSAPALGYVLEHGALRPIVGIPGAAMLGAPVGTGLSIREAAIGGAADYALAIAERTGQASLIRLRGRVSVSQLILGGRAEAL